jgi:acyl carrier protein
VSSPINAHELIIEIVQKNITALAKTTVLSDLDGWDSMHTVRLVLRLEEVLGRQLSEPELESLQSVRDVVRLLGGE